MRRAVVVQFLLCVTASAALAGDGVIEINQAKALAGGVDTCDAAGFPVRICTPGSYRLTSNLDVPRGEDGVELLADFISLDLGGMKVSGSASCALGPNGWVVSCTSHFGGGILGYPSRGSLRNGAVSGFDDCALLGESALVSDLLVTNCQVGLVVGDQSIVERASARGILSTGIQGGNGVRVADVVVAENADRGLWLLGSGSLTGVVARSNGGFGIVAGPGSTLTDFSSERSGGVGVWASAGALVSAGSIRNSGVANNTLPALVVFDGAAYQGVVITSGNGGNTASAQSIGGVNLGQNACQGVPCP